MNSRHLVLVLAAAGALLLSVSVSITGPRRSAVAPAASHELVAAALAERPGELEPVADRDAAGDRTRSGLQERGPWAAPAGSAFVYDVRADLDMVMAAESASGETAEFSLEGKLRVELLARREGELLLGVALHDVVMRAAKNDATEEGGEPLEGLASQLAESSLVRMSEAGDTLAYRFPASMEPEARNWIRTLVAAARFVVPEEHETTWETTETDATGRFLARYEHLDACRVRKEKLRYLDAVQVGESALLPEVSGGASGEFDLARGWLARCEVEESTAFALPEAGLSLRIGTRIRLEHSCLERCAPIAGDPWVGPWASLDGQGEETSSDRAERNEDLRLLDGATLDDLLAEIEDSMTTGDPSSFELFLARQKLAALVRLRPETLSTLQDLLVQGFLDDGVAEVVLSAVGAAGTSASELFLTELVSDEQVMLSHRLGAVVSLFQLEHPSPETFAAIRGLVLRSDVSADLGNSSLLLLGALASVSEGPVKADQIASLLALKESASDASLWLRALGNCGGGEILEAVTPYLDHADHALRLAAVESLRGVPGQSAFELLDRMARADASLDVRAAAAELLGQRWDDGAETAVRQILENDSSAIVRSRALNGVALAALHDEAARSLLLYYAERDPDASVRAHARQLFERSQT